MQQIPDIYIAGSGNLAWNLTQAFVCNHLPVKGIWSIDANSANELAQQINIPALTEYEFLSKNGLFFLCVNDSSIEAVAQKLSSKTLIHCAGSIPLSILLPYTQQAAVFYPLQTFNKNKTVTFNNIPIFVEASNDDLRNQLTNIAEKIGSNPYTTNSEQRLFIHLAAVFANNFSNFMITLAQEIAENHGLEKNIFKPLLLETFQNAIELSAQKSQTGPAIRNDQVTIKKHLEILHDNPELKKIYSFVTESIIQHYKNERKS